MKVSAMPASVESSAARGVDLRIRSATKAPAELDEARADAGDEPGLPGDACGIGRAGGLGGELRRQHHQEDVGEQRDGVDAVGQRADVGAGRCGAPARSACQA